MSVESSNDVTWEGQIYYKQRATFAQYHLFWGVLCRESGLGPKRLELYDKRCSPTRRVSPVTTIPLTDVLHIDSRTARSSKHSFQVLATGSKFHFATKTAHEREQWIKHLNSLLFGPPLPGIVYEFQVEVLSNSHADQLRLQGKYILKISSSDMALTCANGKLPTRFHCGLTEILRTRYTTFMDAGQQFSVLVIYTKESSEVGEGTFVFRALSAADISRVIDQRVRELCQDSAVESLSKTLNLNLPYSPPSSSMTLPRTQPMLTSPHHSEIFEIARSKTASAPQKRLNISLDSGDSYVQFTKVPKGYLPSPNESGYSASVDSSGFHRTGFLPLDPIFRHLSSPDEEYSSRGEVASSLSVDSPLSEYHSADDPQTLRSVASYNGTREATGVPVHYGEQRVSNSPESQGLQQDGGGEIVDYVNVQRGSFLILPVLEPVVKQSKPPIPLPRKKRPSEEQLHTSLSHSYMTGNHSNGCEDHVTITKDRVSKVNFTILEPVEETENTTSGHTAETTFEDPASWVGGAEPTQQWQHNRGTDPSRSSATMIADERPRAESTHSPFQKSDSDLDLEEMHNYLRILPPDTVPSSHTAGSTFEYNASVTVAADEQPRAESAHSPILDPILPDSELDLEDMNHYLRILPSDTVPSSYTADDNYSVGRRYPSIFPVVPVTIRSPTSDRSSPHSRGDSPLWGDMDSPTFESSQLPVDDPPMLESSEHGKYPPTFLSPAFPHISLKSARSVEILPSLGSSLPVQHQKYIHQLLTHTTSAQPSTSKQQYSSESPTASDGEEHEGVGDTLHEEDMSQSRLVESRKLSSESDFMSLDMIAQLNMNGQATIPPLNQPQVIRPDHFDEVFEGDTESDDGYTQLLSLPDIDSDGYAKPKFPGVPYGEQQSAARPSPFTSSHQDTISRRPPAPLPGMTNMQPFLHGRGYHHSLTRVRSHSDGAFKRCSDIYEDQDIWYDYAKISAHTKRPIIHFNQIGGYVDINRWEPEDPRNQQPVLGAGYDPGNQQAFEDVGYDPGNQQAFEDVGYDPGNQQAFEDVGYDRLPMGGPESSQISDLQVHQSDLSTSQVTVEHSEPDWGEINGTDQPHSSIIDADQSSSRTNVSQSDQYLSGFTETDQSDFSQTDHSRTNVSQTNKSDSTSVSNTDQSYSRDKIPPPVRPKPPRSRVNVKFETPV